MRGVIRLLRLVAPFRLLLPLLILLAGSGVWLHLAPRFATLSWGLTEMLHVQFGWGSVLLFLAYQAHHLAAKWGNFADRHRIEGLLLAGCTVGVLGSGIWLVVPTPGGPPEWVLPAHWFGTFVMVGLTLLHTFGGLRRWLRAQRAIVRPPVTSGRDEP